MKKVFVLVIILILLFSFTAISGGEGEIVFDDPVELFIAAMEEIKNEGQRLAGEGFLFQSESYYAFAGASVSSLRYAVENILWLKGEGKTFVEFTQESLYVGWDVIASICYASPYPYYFEGLLWQLQGEDDKAEFCYAAALLNPSYPEEGIIFYELRYIDIEGLYQLREELRDIEDEIYSLFTPNMAAITRDVLCFDPEYLRVGTQEAIEDEDYALAYEYAKAAQIAEPFNVNHYVNASVCALLCRKLAETAMYIDEGLLLDGENESLNMIYGMLLDVMGVAE